MHVAQPAHCPVHGLMDAGVPTWHLHSMLYFCRYRRIVMAGLHVIVEFNVLTCLSMHG